MLAIVDLRILCSVGTFTNSNSFSIFFTIFLTNTYHMEAESLRTRVGVKSGDCSINWLNSIVCWTYQGYQKKNSLLDRWCRVFKANNFHTRIVFFKIMTASRLEWPAAALY